MADPVLITQAKGHDTFVPGYLAALDDLPFPLRLCDRKGDARFVNRAWLAATGSSVAAEEGSGWIARIHPDDLQAVLATQGALKRGEAHQVEYRIRDAGGDWLWLRETGNPVAGAGITEDTPPHHLCTCHPITDQRKAEEQRLRAEERFNAINTLAHVGTFEMDARTKAVSWTPQVYDLFGVPPDTDMAEAFALWAARLHPEDRDETIARSHAATDGSGTLDFDFRMIHPDRGIRDIELRSCLIRDAAGIARIIGVMTDATDRNRSAQAFREAEQRLGDISENFPGVVYQRVAHPDGRAGFTHFSGADARLMEIPHNRFAGLLTVSRPPGKDGAATDADAAAAPGLIDRIGTVVGSGGDRRWVRSRARAERREDGATVMTGFLVDVTAEKLHEAELERTATKLRLTMAVAGIGIWELDPQTRRITGSPLVNTMFGLPVDDTWRETQDYFAALHPEDRAMLEAQRFDELARAERIENEVRVRRLDGVWRRLSYTAMGTRLSDGSSRIIGVVSDVTERRAHEQEQEEALRLIQLLLGEVNHRVKNNLQVILALLRLLRPRDPQAAAASTVAIRHIEVIGDIYADYSFREGQGRIDLGQHMRRMTYRLSAAGRRTRCTAPPCLIEIEQAVPLGLVVNDLVDRVVTATGGRRADAATITIDLACGADGSLDIEIGTIPSDRVRSAQADWPSRPDLPLATSGAEVDMGLQIVAGLCGQIDATLERNPVAGVAYRLTLPARGNGAAISAPDPAAGG